MSSLCIFLSFATRMKNYASTNNNLEHLDLSCVAPRSFLCLKFYMHLSSCLSSNARCRLSLILPHMLVLKASHFEASCFNVLKRRLLVYWSICGLCKKTQDNTMMIEFFRDEMTSMTIFLVCDVIVTFYALVSCVTSSRKVINNFNGHWCVFYHQWQLMLPH
jgi:hypothetical protein